MAVTTMIQTSGEGGAQTIAAIALQNGKSLSADLYIDCSGPAAKLMTALPAAAAAQPNAPPSNAPPRRLKAAARFETQAKLGPPRRRLIAHNFGWQSETPLQGRQQHLIIYDPASQAAALEALGGAPSESAEIEIKRLDTPWRGNCAAIGQSAAAIEPLTPAPMMMLQADISRLLELIPVGEDMTIERREYNRRFRGDHAHAALFGAAFFAANAKAGPRASGNLDLGSPYWRAAKAYYARADADGKLRAKLTQFKSRGALVTFDCEPFSPQDWVMLYFGLGHDPARYDPLADRMPSAQVEATLARMKMAIAQMAEKMPPHHVYMTNLLRYLKEQT
jgi:tryptophan halogenase